MDRKQATRLSKFLSLVLRHRPDEYGLHMDEVGFVDFESLIDVIVAEDIAAETAEDDVREIVEGSDRRRFEIRDGKIRALYGHSSRVRLDYPDQDPPERLYHGTSVASAYRVSESGLQPDGRAYVHLSSTAEEADSIGRRNDDDPVIVEIDTAAARAAGTTFYQATDLIWLCSAIPADACKVPTLPERPRVERAAHERSSSDQAARPRGGVRLVEPDASQEFKRRTRKKTGRR
ncbi:MAG: RNA 2'-phosphotransferase [bacterium]